MERQLPPPPSTENEHKSTILRTINLFIHQCRISFKVLFNECLSTVDSGKNNRWEIFNFVSKSMREKDFCEWKVIVVSLFEIFLFPFPPLRIVNLYAKQEQTEVVLPRIIYIQVELTFHIARLHIVVGSWKKHEEHCFAQFSRVEKSWD